MLAFSCPCSPQLLLPNPLDKIQIAQWLLIYKVHSLTAILDELFPKLAELCLTRPAEAL